MGRRGKKNKSKSNYGKKGTTSTKKSSGGTTTKKSTSTFKASPPCHSGNLLVFETHGIKVYAGGRNRSGGWKNSKYVIDVIIGPREVLYDLPRLPQGWNISKWLPQFVPVPWPDFSIPNWSSEFWDDLWQDLLEQDVKDILVQCAGGHGRTGTMLCIIAGLAEIQQWPTVIDIVKWVRHNYCDHAVETQSQLNYISRTLGIPVGDDPDFVLDDRWSYSLSYDGYGSGGSFKSWEGSGDWYSDTGFSKVSEKEKKSSSVFVFDDDWDYDPMRDGPITDEMLESLGALPPDEIRAFCTFCKKTTNMIGTYWGDDIGGKQVIEGECERCEAEMLKIVDDKKSVR